MTTQFMANSIDSAAASTWQQTSRPRPRRRIALARRSPRRPRNVRTTSSSISSPPPTVSAAILRQPSRSSISS